MSIFRKKIRDAEEKAANIIADAQKEAAEIIERAIVKANDIIESANEAKERIEDKSKKLLEEVTKESENAQQLLNDIKTKLDQEKATLQTDMDNFKKEKKEKISNLERKKLELDERLYEYQKKMELSDIAQKAFIEKKDELHEKELELQQRESELKLKESALKKIEEGKEQKIELGDTIEFSTFTIKKPVNKLPISVLPNGMVGKAYNCSLQFKYSQDKYIHIVDIKGLEESGLFFDPSTMSITGFPKIKGARTIILKYKILDNPTDHSNAESFEVELQLLILPDPKSLWKNLRPPEDGIFYKESEDQKNLILKNKKILGASKRGRSHAHEGSFRDDHFIIENLENDWVFLAVADGAGSARFSREGSKISCEASLNSIKSKLNDIQLDQLILDGYEDQSKQKALRKQLYDLFGSAIMNVIDGIQKSAKKHNHDVKDYATTLIFSLIKDFEFGSFIATYWIGDGAAAVYTTDNIYLLGSPDGGEFAGQTRFITMPDVINSRNILRRIHYQYIDRFDALFLMTDGVSDPLFQTDSNLRELKYWHSLWKEIREKVDLNASQEAGHQLLEWLNFWSQGNHDDRTVLIMYQ